MSALLELDRALELLKSIERRALPSEAVRLDEAVGRILASDLPAPFDLPRFDNSAVDGFALRSSDASAGAVLRIVGDAFAGRPHADPLQPGTAVRIATGGVMPAGCDAAAMLETCEDRGSEVMLRESVAEGANRRRAGQDVGAGVVVLKRGSRLSAASIAMAAALGHREVVAQRRLKVAVASTGSELIDTGSPGAGEIYDSNRVMLRALLLPYNVDVTDLGIIPDDPEATRATLRQAARDVDLIVTSGGVSVGARDYVRETLEAGGDVLFKRLAIRPGKPVLCGRLGGIPLVGLPGNPVSAFVTFALICRPLLLHLAGLPAALPTAIPVRLGVGYRKPPALREFIRVTLERGDGAMIARPFRSQQSNLVSSLVESDGLLDLPLGPDWIAEGETVNFLPWTGFRP